jgi:predicted PurR-regulated permease PerM
MDMDIPTPQHDSVMNSKPQNIAVAAMALGLFMLGIYTLWHFLSALAWAGIFAVALWPFYRRMQARFGEGKHNILLPSLFTLGVALVFIVPIGLVGMQLAKEAHNMANWLHNAHDNGVPEPDALRHLPFFQTQVDSWWQENLADPQGAKNLVERTSNGRVGSMSREIGAQVARRLTLFVFTLVTLFFLFRSGHEVTQQMRRAASRTFGPNGERVGRQIIASIHGTVDGLVLVGLGEGVLMGIVYGVAGVPHATVLGAVTAVAAIIPFGAPVVFAIAALLLLANGSVVWAIAVICIGFAMTLAADHFVRPVLIGGATQLPFIWVLLGILGGVEMWGLLGLFLGPAIMAALMMLWREWAGERPA